MPARIQSPQLGSPKTGEKLLREFDVTRNGFLPTQAPLARLDDPYYAPWETLAEELPSRLKDFSVRDAIDRWPVLTTNRLETEEEWRRAYVVLTFLAHGYIWGGETPSEVLPPAITVPLLEVSRRFDLPPTATYAGLCLWNFTSTTNNFGDLDSLKALTTFTGTEDESWFYMLSVAMEAKCASVMPAMYSALEAIPHRDYGAISEGLNEMIACIDKMDRLLARMYEKCDPAVFYQDIRPFLAGSKGMEKAGLPRGVFYDEGEGKGEWMKWMGGSNGQSSLIQFLDIVLGIEHAPATAPQSSCPLSNLPTQEGAMGYHEEVRLMYMPKPHRSFLAQVGSMDSLHKFVSTPCAGIEHKKLQQLHGMTCQAMGAFRDKHIQMVTRYILLQSKKQQAGNSFNLASSSAQSKGSDLKGTGGTSLFSFLKQTRDETYSAGCLATQARQGGCPMHMG
ncbi:Indoleamine 2,3-dioxygenase [Xylariales sp. PMI_506]|nr:Indoleamine 2,3-dioxygenase [Xylariales sp. PMI_506]